MDLSEQAEQAASRVLADAGFITTDAQTVRLLKMAWLAGMKAGMAATKQITDDALETLGRAL